jgi:FKBP-type peptidyl-prolyl cis-trans isomerase FkpA/FKBP-type peptidyl-prolyl cis-trans isomerase FklB
MKFVISIVLVIFALSCQSGTSKGDSKSISSLDSFKDSTSYALGADLGENLKRQNVEIDYDMYLAGLTDALETGIVKLDQQQRRQVMSSLQKSIRNRGKVDGEKNLKVAEDFLKNNKLNNPNIKETPSGLQYSVITAGSGDSPNKTDRVKVHYVGTLIDGSEFDSSIKRGEPAVFGLDQVIRGWTEGLQLMKVGAKYKFYIHPKIAYGSRDKPGIPANSALIFEVELLNIVKDSSPNKK